MRRRNPLFIFDTNRCHKFGDCDWIVCTDTKNGFVAKVTYGSGLKPTAGVNERISKPNANGIQVCIRIVRAWIDGTQTVDNAKTQLKQAEKVVREATRNVVVTNEPTTQQVIDYLELLIHANTHALHGAEYSTAEKQTTLTSLQMLQAAIDKLRSL